MSKILKLNRDEAKQDPERFFADPKEILSEPGFTLGEKRKVLQQWSELVGRRLKSASEGMAADSGVDDKDTALQRDINDCLTVLDKERGLEP